VVFVYNKTLFEPHKSLLACFLIGYVIMWLMIWHLLLRSFYHRYTFYRHSPVTTTGQRSWSTLCRHQCWPDVCESIRESGMATSACASTYSAVRHKEHWLAYYLFECVIMMKNGVKHNDILHVKLCTIYICMHFCLGEYLFFYDNSDLDFKQYIYTNNPKKHSSHSGSIKYLDKVKMGMVRLSYY